MNDFKTIIGNNKILIIRYGENIIPNCIQRHKEVVDNEGFCWFGKIGKVPSGKILNETINTTNKIILYSKNDCFICNCMEYSIEQPTNHYPNYYDECIFNKGINPPIYFKLQNIEYLNKKVLEDLVISSSGNALINVLNKSMNSFFVAELKGTKSFPKKKKEEINQQIINKNSICKFLIDGKCANKKSVNYKYECLRPNMCIKQTL
jgi:hypothetical protein